MPCEIERKFLVRNDSWKSAVTEKHHLLQGYAQPGGALGTIRFRIVDDAHGFLTLKGRMRGISRSEFEYELPVDEVKEMLRLFGCGFAIEKIRYIVPAGDLKWEIDEFLGDNAGLVVAEIELPDADAPYPHLAWLGEEVSLDRRYGNGSLSRLPFTHWDKGK